MHDKLSSWQLEVLFRVPNEQDNAVNNSRDYAHVIGFWVTIGDSPCYSVEISSLDHHLLYTEEFC